MSPHKRKGHGPTDTPSKRLKESHTSGGEFRVVKTILTLSVPPIFAAHPKAGVEELLDSMIMRYNPSLQGVILSHSNITFVNPVATIQRDCPFLICKIAFDATVWSPQVGFKLSGKVNLCSPDHISLLVHKTFNASIPRNHIPTDIWEFEYGPAENDPEFGEEVRTNENGKEQDGEHSTGGKWVHRVTGDVLGGDNGLVEVTVVGLTVANEMLSVLGSLQPDPFSPRHVVHPPNVEEKSESGDGSESEDDSEEEGSDDSEESEEDTLQLLGKRKDAEEQRERAEKRRRKG
ncbi:hypothetical protein NLJ89_g2273 [Agrocybe chaxingu]|uniref:RPA43 OB domain-containing protein n=1 Tax=Agrocybe chaxingu TaxID=84603 RepID=A0A9W8K7N4_9AGAR|nr:hypothetical protein NLJ89_g2273 [Agrocybe chaxingu]